MWCKCSYALTDRMISCSQPWLLWQPCFGRWVYLCMLVCSAGQKKKKRPHSLFPRLKQTKEWKALHLFVSALPALANICLPRSFRVFARPAVCIHLFTSSIHLCLPPLTELVRGFICSLDDLMTLKLKLFPTRVVYQLQRRLRVPLWMEGT